jgi:glycosyltransferase involved in cell wall biosynthesis
MNGIKYIAPVLDFSGYGEASRNYILALHEKGIPITVTPRNFDPSPPPIADEYKRETLNSLINKDIDYDTIIIHLTPDLYPHYIETGKYNIGFAAWETSLLPPKWVHTCNILNEMWVPCRWNKDSVKNSGVTVPVHIIPHGIDINLFDSAVGKEFSISTLDKSTFKFYSIFQWIHRKNPEGLLRSYFNAFDESDNVALILKTYRTVGGKDKGVIRDKILEIKKDMNIGAYPKVILVGDILSTAQMLGLHIYGDCCVGLHRGEGWGLPLFEAGLAGKPVIATSLGGNTEFMTKENSYLVDYQETYVSNMSSFNPWYLGSGTWAEPNQIHTSQLMKEVFYNRDEAIKKGNLLKENIVANFSWGCVADMVIERLKNI